MQFQQLEVGTDSVKLLQRNLSRTSFIIFNTDAANIAYIHQLQGVNVDNGFPIQPGGSFSAKVPEDDPVGEIWIVSDGAATDIRFYEGFGK